MIRSGVDEGANDMHLISDTSFSIDPGVFYFPFLFSPSDFYIQTLNFVESIENREKKKKPHQTMKMIWICSKITESIEQLLFASVIYLLPTISK